MKKHFMRPFSRNMADGICFCLSLGQKSKRKKSLLCCANLLILQQMPKKQNKVRIIHIYMITMQYMKMWPFFGSCLSILSDNSSDPLLSLQLETQMPVITEKKKWKWEVYLHFWNSEKCNRMREIASTFLKLFRGRTRSRPHQQTTPNPPPTKRCWRPWSTLMQRDALPSMRLNETQSGTLVLSYGVSTSTSTLPEEDCHSHPL